MNNDVIVNILGSRNYNQRRQIITSELIYHPKIASSFLSFSIPLPAFKTNYGQDLDKLLLSKSSGDFKDLLGAMMMTPDVLDAWTVEKSIKGLGTDDDTLIEILCTRDNYQIKAMRDTYQKSKKTSIPFLFFLAILSKSLPFSIVHNRSIESDVHDDTSGDYRNLLKSLLAANRDESNRVNMEEAKADATALFKAGADKIGTDEDVFIKIMTTRNFPQLRLIFDHYEKVLCRCFPLSLLLLLFTLVFVCFCVNGFHP